GRVWTGAVAGRDVEHPVVAEVQIAAVVPAAQERDDDFFGRGVDLRRIRVRYLEPRYPRAVHEVAALPVLPLERVADVAVAVLLELRVEHESVQFADPLRVRVR